MKGGALYINDVAVQREALEDWEGEGRFGAETAIDQYRETLPNGVSYLTLDSTERSAGDDTRVYEVPEGHFFLMGDNRDNSQDSRFLDGPVGFVPAENLVGRADILFFSVDGSPAWAFWNWPTSLRWDRIFDTL
jgi:signal peptidase I